MQAYYVHARGIVQVTERLLLFTAVNSVFAYVLLTLLLPFLHIEHQASWAQAVLHPLYLLWGSLVAGWLACIVMLRLAAWLGKSEERQFVLMVGMVVVGVGVAHALKLSVSLTLITLGVLARNLDRAGIVIRQDQLLERGRSGDIRALADVDEAGGDFANHLISVRCFSRHTST